MRKRNIVVAVFVVALVIIVFASWSSEQSDLASSKKVTMQNIQVTSSEFSQNGMIPERFTCDAANTSLPLEIGKVPVGAKSLAFIMHDPDAAAPGGWTHWVKFNMPAQSQTIHEGMEPAGVSGNGSSGKGTYQGPCPPAGSGAHRYFFNVYALDTMLSLKEGATKTEVESAMQGHIISKGELIGLYSHKQ